MMIQICLNKLVGKGSLSLCLALLFFGLGGIFSISPIQAAWAEDRAFFDPVFTGKLQTERPRILFAEPSQVERIRERYRRDDSYRKRVDKYTSGASRWLCAKDREAGRKALNKLLDTSVQEPQVQGDYGNGIELALTYDLHFDHPDWTLDRGETQPGER